MDQYLFRQLSAIYQAAVDAYHDAVRDAKPAEELARRRMDCQTIHLAITSNDEEIINRILANHPAPGYHIQRNEPDGWEKAWRVVNNGEHRASFRYADEAEDYIAHCEAEDWREPTVVAHMRWPLKGSMAGERFPCIGEIPADMDRGLFGAEPLMTVAQHKTMSRERWEYFRRKMRTMRDFFRGERNRHAETKAELAELQASHAAAKTEGLNAELPSYHDLHITFDGIPRTSIFDLPFSVAVHCTRAAGWEVWETFEGKSKRLAAEYPDANMSGLRLDVDGRVVVDSLKKPETSA